MTANTKLLAIIAKLLGILFLLYFLASHLMATPAFSADFDYRRDTGFEKKIYGRFYTCMPKPLPLLIQNYSYRVLEEVFNECVIENTNRSQAIKYAVLATGIAITAAAATTATAGGATVAAAGLAATGGAIADYTSGELVSDGMKCVLKAFVEASSMSSKEKRAGKVAIDGAFTLKDWAAFTKSIPEMTDPDDIKSLNAAVGTLAAAYERSSESQSVIELMSSLANTTKHRVRQAASGVALTEFRDAKTAFKQCDFSRASKLLENAEKLARNECSQYGIDFRLAERELRTHIFLNRRSLRDKRIYNPVDKTTAENKFIRLTKDLENEKDRLEKFTEIFLEIDKVKQGQDKQSRAYTKAGTSYWAQVGEVRRAMDGHQLCHAVEKLNSILEGQEGQCREGLFMFGDEPVSRPEELYRDINKASNDRSQSWWNQIELIRSDYSSCNVSAAKAAISQLKADITAHPIYVISYNQCRKSENPVLLERLAGFRTPKHCLKRAIPDVTGFSITNATDALYEANLTPGKTRVEKPASADQKPRTIIRTEPKAKAMVKSMTTVDLYIYGARKAEDLVTMPEVIGKTGDDAAGLVNGAGLIATVDYKEAADELDKTPYQVFGASHATGDMLAKGSSVVIRAYGPRPYVAVPSIAKLTEIAASGVLTAKKFIMTEPVRGIPAPPDKEPGEIYGSKPPAESLQEIFTNVQPLFYGPHKVEFRPVPEVAKMSVATAKGVIIGEDGFFVFGGRTLGIPAPPGKQVGEVYAAIPACKSSQPKGTVIEVLVYGLHENANAAPDDDQDSDEPPQPADIVVPEPVTDEPPITDTNPPPDLPVVTPEPQTPQEPAQQADDDGWIGRWHITGEIMKNAKIDMDIEIVNGPEGPVLVGENGERLPAIIKGNTLISSTNKGSSSNPDPNGGSDTANPSIGDFGISAGVGAAVSPLVEFLNTLTFEITKTGSTCDTKLSFKIKNKRRTINARLTCTRL